MFIMEKTTTPSRVITKYWLWLVFVNIPLLGFTFYVHALLHQQHYIHNNNWIEQFGIWLLVAFKLIGANLTLGAIFFNSKTK